MSLVDVERLRQIAEVEFADIVATFPHHFHDGSEGNVVESHLGESPEGALREFLAFVRERLGIVSGDD